MTPEQFVDAIIKTVYQSSINGTVSLLSKPPGRKPAASLLRQSEWYLSQSDEDRDMIKSAIALGVAQAVFGMLAVLDGVHVIEDTPDKGDLELRYINNERNVLLNDPKGEYLHDLFNQQAPPL